MGRSAKVHKRVKKTKSSTSSHPAAAPQPVPPVTTGVAKKRTSGGGLKAKSKSSAIGVKDGSLLGGADYVNLALGGRRKAQREAEKLAKVDLEEGS